MSGGARTGEQLTEPFWDAADRGELVRPVCAVCERSHFSPQVLCPMCQSPDWSYQPSTGEGQVYSHTTVHRPPTPQFVGPYVVADIEMVEGWRMLSWVVGCEPSEVHVGMHVGVTFIAGPTRAHLPVFRPAASGDPERFRVR